jgi:hypothetical protein
MMEMVRDIPNVVIHELLEESASDVVGSLFLAGLAYV